MIIYDDVELHNNNINDCGNWPTGSSGSVQAAYVSQAAQSDLYQSGQRKVQFSPTLSVNTIVGVSISDSIITLPSGIYQISARVVGQSTASNTGAKLGYKINGASQAAYSQQHFVRKSVNHTYTFSTIFAISSGSELQFYLQQTTGGGTFYTVNSAGGVQIIRIGDTA